MGCRTVADVCGIGEPRQRHFQGSALRDVRETAIGKPGLEDDIADRNGVTTRIPSLSYPIRAARQNSSDRRTSACAACAAPSRISASPGTNRSCITTLPLQSTVFTAPPLQA